MRTLLIVALGVLTTVVLIANVAKSTPPSPPPIGSVYPLGYASPSASYVPIAVDANGNVNVNSAQNDTGPASPVTCDSTMPIDYGSMATHQLVPLSSGKKIYICSLSFATSGIVNVKFVEGTGSNCAVLGMNPEVTGPFPMLAGENVAMGSGVGMVAETQDASQELCINLSASVQTSGVLTYTQY